MFFRSVLTLLSNWFSILLLLSKSVATLATGCRHSAGTLSIGVMEGAASMITEVFLEQGWAESRATRASRSPSGRASPAGISAFCGTASDRDYGGTDTALRWEVEGTDREHIGTMKTEELPIATLKPSPYNPRRTSRHDFTPQGIWSLLPACAPSANPHGQPPWIAT